MSVATTPLIYDPATNRYSGLALQRGDVLTDAKSGQSYSVERANGFMLTLTELQHATGKLYRTSRDVSFSVDPGIKSGRWGFHALTPQGWNIFDTDGKRPVPTPTPAWLGPISRCDDCKHVTTLLACPCGGKLAPLSKAQAAAYVEKGHAAFDGRPNPAARCRRCGKGGRVDLRGGICIACAIAAEHAAGMHRKQKDADCPQCATARPTRSNPALILVHGNPRPPAEVERAWCKFHERDSFTGTLRDLGKIPGAPAYTFALGRCVDVDLGRGYQKFDPRPWLVYSPDDEALWIVSEKAYRYGSGLAGAEVHGITYDPQASSGKDPAKYRHRFEPPLPTFSPTGNPNYTRAVMLDGGNYRVTDWIHD